MRIPHGVLETILDRARKQGLVRRQDGLFHPVEEEMSKKVVDADRAEWMRRFVALVSSLITFAKEGYSRMLTPKEADSVLDRYLSDFAASIVLEGATAEIEFEREVVIERATEFIVHAFVEHLAGSDPHSFEYLHDIVEGNMLRMEAQGDPDPAVPGTRGAQPRNRSDIMPLRHVPADYLLLPIPK